MTGILVAGAIAGHSGPPAAYRAFGVIGLVRGIELARRSNTRPVG
ncbi:MAG: hypothetical protein ACYC9Q_07065 [Bacillota bacterium]